MRGELLGLYVFGSIARGERDEWSDLDLLAVVADGRGKVPETDILSLVPASLHDLRPSISWYGRDRLKRMFSNGELFAWHLQAETIPLFEQEPVIASLAPPAPYRGAAEDIASFEKILTAIPDQVAAVPENATYELGLIYVCLRNICMAASWVLCGRADFSRHSPFNLERHIPLPISRAEYQLAMACRMAGQRGLDPPLHISIDRVQDMHSRLVPWIAALGRRLEVAS